MARKKVLYFCGGNKIFGAEIVTLSVLKEMKRKDYELLCITNGWNDGKFQDRLDKLEISYVSVKLGMLYLTRLLWTLDTLIHLPKALYTIRKIIQKFDPDVICHVSYGSLLFTYPLLKDRKNVFFIFDPYYGKLKKQYFKWLNKFVHTYVAVSNAIKYNLIEIGALPDKILVLKNGINTEFSSDFRVPGPVVQFGVVGQIIPRKGHEVIIEALRILKTRNVECKCVIIGSGEADFVFLLKEKIQRYNLEDKVSWFDFIANRDEIYGLFDVILIPSTTLDPLPTTAMEAGLYYKPAIVSNIGGLPEIVIDNQTGFVIPPNNAAALAEKMEALMDADKVRQMGESAHENIVNNFDIQSQIKPLFKLIDE